MSSTPRRRAVRRLVLAAGLLAAAAAPAETLYVVDRLEIGVHETRSVDSVVVEVVPTGTALEVLERRDEFVKVRTPEGNSGWVDAAYVTEEQPAALAVDALEEKLAETMRELGAARAEVEVLRQQLEEGTAQEAGAQASTSEPTGDAAALGTTLGDLQALAEENQRLKRQLSELRAEHAASLEAVRTAQAAPAEAHPAPELRESPTPPATPWLRLGPWQWMLAGFVLLLAFALGGYFVDWQTRRRHGGFRI